MRRREIATLDNVICKISGLPVEGGPNWSIDTVRPYVEHIVDALGFDRIMFGSDYPAQDSVSNFVDSTAAVVQIMSETSADENDRYFYRNAVRYYRMDVT
jgi:predicted TIM-barrel fold metal-dependent hydrolase